MNTMWNRKDLKAKGKIAFKANYWKCVLVSLILGMIGGGASYSFNSGDTEQMQEAFANSGIEGAIQSIPAAVWGVTAAVIIFAIAIGIAISVFVLNPLKIGCTRFYTVNANDKADLNELGFGFTHKYMNGVKTMFLTDLYLFLWSLLFILPGIVKSYSYRMVPYLISENPEMTAKEAIDKSREIMNGQKWNAFVLDLSFLGWIILSVLTLGILAIFYVSPYIDQTNAELYHALKPVKYDDVTEEPVYAEPQY